ncbi:uncharacterized protein HD556DRAFT_1311588 [Suillus plorans]|uniref:Uncharacterized protein n=1 Tax=Suillus plorans TaxID=116603 RepID=A0A9P7AGL8_9AGAM|nr:uncharacterized protein HD556DRAFT_1311588 [Suillus plorans]KAG1789008.1 hypothetical protein HD556DRAFT_1311588 [Suillus plorans]
MARSAFLILNSGQAGRLQLNAQGNNSGLHILQPARTPIAKNGPAYLRPQGNFMQYPNTKNGTSNRSLINPDHRLYCTCLTHFKMENSDITFSHYSNPTTHTAMRGATDPDMSHKFKSPVSTALQHANQEKETYRDTSPILNGVGGVAQTQSGLQLARVVGKHKPYTAEQNHKIEVWKDVDRAAMKNLKKEHSSSILHATETAIVEPTMARQNYKRKIDDVQDHDTVKDSDVYQNFAPVVKRICQEKTGTDWQTVLDVIKYGEEREKLAEERMAKKS